MSDKHYTALLRVHIKSASNLRDADIGGKSDPYVLLSFEHSSEAAPKSQQTHVIKDSLNPVWDTDLYFLVSDEFQQFKVQVYDEDTGRDNKLGHCHVLRRDEDVRGKLTGDNYYLEDGKGGTVEVYTQELDLKRGLGHVFAEKGKKIQEFIAGKRRDNYALLEAYVHSAENLKSGMIDKSDPYAKFDFSNDPDKEHIYPHKLRTRTIQDNPNPVWEEAFHFLVPFELKTFKLEVMDEDVGSDDSLGHLNVAVGKVGTVKARDKMALNKKGAVTLSYALVPLKPLFE
jgi:Ca2+-dependent lipid-binding protein